MEELRSLVSQVAEIVYEAERVEDVIASLGLLSSLVLNRQSLPHSLRRPRDDSKLCELEKLVDKAKESLSGEVLRRTFYQCGLFPCISKLLISKVAPDWLACFTAAEQDTVFYAFFLSAPPSEAILELVPAMSQGHRSEDENDLSTVVRIQVERVLAEVLVDSSGIQKTCQEMEIQLPERGSNIYRLAQLVASIPDRAGTRSPASLRAPMFVASAVAQVCESPCSGGGSCLFVSELLGKLCRRGHADVVASEVLFHLLQLIPRGEASGTDEAGGQFLHSVVGSMQDTHALEKLLEALLLRMHKCALPDFEAYKILLLFLGNPSSLKPTIRAVLTSKFLLLKSFAFPVLKWLLDFLVFRQPEACASGLPVQDVQKDVVRTLAESWAELNYIQSATVAQQIYLTAALGISLKAMKKEDVSTTDNLLKSLLDGISRRLESPLQHVRRTAKQIALAFSSVVTPNSPLLLDDEDSVDELSIWDVPGQRSENSVSVTEPEEPTEVKPRKKTSRKPLRVDPDAVVDLSEPAMQSLLDESEDESESEGSLQPYDMSDDELGLDKSKYPSQLAECANDLRKDDHDAVERALEVCEKLVRFMPDELGYSASDLAHALVHVRCSSLAVEGEEETAEAKRRGALVALLACSPLEAASVLTKELYSAHVDVSQRLMILDVLSEAATELANGTNDNTVRAAGPWKEVDRPAPGNPMISWCQTFERELPPKAGQRQVGRSRRWANRSLQLRKQNLGADGSTGARKNKFAPVAAAFMLPVMRDFDKRSHGVDFLGRDYVVLGRLIQMLGVCLECIAFHTEAAALGAGLLDMLRTRAIANHPEPYVRRAVLFAVSRVLVALHPSQVVGGLSQGGSSSLEEGLDWVREWAARVADNDPDTDTSKMAIACLQLHSEVALEASRSAKPSSSRSPLIIAL